MGNYSEPNMFFVLWGFPLLPADPPFASNIFSIYLAPCVLVTEDDKFHTVSVRR